MPKGTVTVRKSGNLIDISEDGIKPLQQEVRRLIEPQLEYTKKKFLYGRERYNHATGMQDRRIETTQKRCFRYDAYGRMVTTFGFATRIIGLLYDNNYTVEVFNKDDVKTGPDHYEVDMDNVLKHFQFRPRQEDCLNAIIENPIGLIDAATAFGKMAMIAMVCLAFPYAKIDIVTRSKTLVNKTNEYLTRYIANVGQYGGGRKQKGRVTVYTAKSLHYSEFDADIVLCDEAHQLMADEASKELAQYANARMYSLTASPEGRIDGTDIRMEALFGPTIFNLSYQEAVELGLVVPIRVEWSDVGLMTNPCAGLDGVWKKRRGIWQNAGRNQVIANKVNTFGKDDQILITVEFIEHAVYLWQHFKNDEVPFTLVYAKSDDIDDYMDEGLLPGNFPNMTDKLREHYRQQFEAGKLKRVISTMWDVGIDPIYLTALVRAEATDSKIDDIQAPGRVARINEKEENRVGVVCDFRDQFDQSYERRAKSRQGRYNGMGWTQMLTKLDGTLTSLLT